MHSFKTDQRDLVVKAVNGTDAIMGLLYDKLPEYLEILKAPSLRTVSGNGCYRVVEPGHVIHCLDLMFFPRRLTKAVD